MEETLAIKPYRLSLASQTISSRCEESAENDVLHLFLCKTNTSRRSKWVALRQHEMSRCAEHFRGRETLTNFLKLIFMHPQSRRKEFFRDKMFCPKFVAKS